MAADTTDSDAPPADTSDSNDPDPGSSASDEVRYRLKFPGWFNVFFFPFGLGSLYTAYESALRVPLQMWGMHEMTILLGGIGVAFSCLFYMPTYCVELTDEEIRMSFYVGIGPLVLFRHERSAPWTHIFSVSHISFPLGWTFIRADHKPGPLWMKYVMITTFFGMTNRRDAMHFIRQKVPNEVLDTEFKFIWGESLKGE